MLPVSFQVSLQIIGIPEVSMIKEFTAQDPDQSLDKRMPAGRIGNGFDLLNLQDAKIRPPAATPEHCQN
jgi:hypothetical protein